MKQKKEQVLIVILSIAIFCVIGIIGIDYLKRKNIKKEENVNIQESIDNNIISKNDYLVSYTINEQYIQLELKNLTSNDIHFASLIIKKDNQVIATHQANLTILKDEVFLMNIPNYDSLSEDAIIEVVLYHTIKENTPHIDLSPNYDYLCIKDEKHTTDYDSKFIYTFNFKDETLQNSKVYDEYQFKSEDAFKNFVYKVEVDSDYFGETEMQEDKLISKFIYSTKYPIPSTASKNLASYLDYLHNEYGYDCQKNS